MAGRGGESIWRDLFGTCEFVRIFAVEVQGVGGGLEAQVKVMGQVRDAAKGEGIPFVSVSLVSLRDSSQAYRAVSDMSGEYLFERIKIGPYRLRIQSMGYKPQERDLRVVLPSDGRELRLVNDLAPDEQALKEVVVTGVNTKQMADRRVIKFDSKTVKDAFHSYELLRNLPLLGYDPQNDQLKGAMGGSVQLLINGVKATKNDVRMIPGVRDYFSL